MVEAKKTEVSATGFSPHIEELHEFFRSRGVAFGKPEDLTGFAERLSKDESFRDEMASMVRAIIYRERDGLMPAELMELLVTAVAGGTPDGASEPARDALRQVMGFAGGVFRSRWNPGGSVAVATESEARTDAAGSVPVPEPAPRPMTPMFYQAQVVANGGEAAEAMKTPAVADKDEAPKTEPMKAAVAEKAESSKLPEQRPDKTPPKTATLKPPAKTPGDKAPETEQEVVLPLRGTGEARAKIEVVDEPSLSFAGYAGQPEPVVAFLRGEGTAASEAYEAEPRRSRGWAWVAIVFAVVVSFGAGMFARQWMVTRYGPAWPWTVPEWMEVHRPASQATANPAPSNAGPPNAAPAQPAGGGVAGVKAGAPAPLRPRAQVKAARSEWSGGTESASDFGGAAAGSAGGYVAAGNAPTGTSDEGAASISRPAASGLPGQPVTSAAKPSPETPAKALRSARVAAMVGASPALMANHLIFAPEPEYPNLAKLTHIQGPVLVEALVGRDGSVVRAQAVSGHRLLRAAAEEAVYGRRYRPYVVNGVPMAVRTLVTIDFRLR